MKHLYRFFMGLSCILACTTALLLLAAVLVGPLTLAGRLDDGRFLYIYLAHFVLYVYAFGKSVTNKRYSTQGG